MNRTPDGSASLRKNSGDVRKSVFFFFIDYKGNSIIREVLVIVLWLGTFF